MSKLPAFQFYPGDWMKDPALRRCTHEEKGVWIDLLCLMHESPERGVLRGWSDDEIARAIGGRYEAVTQAVTRLVTSGVASRDTDGSLMCRRMARDEQARRTTADRVRRHREKTSCNASSNADVTHEVTPMYTGSSSSSSSSNTGIRDTNGPEVGNGIEDRQFTPPTLEDVKSFAAGFSTPEIAEGFWNAKEAIGWVDRNNIPLRKWKPAFKSYAAAARANGFQRGRSAPQKPAPQSQTPVKGGW